MIRAYYLSAPSDIRNMLESHRLGRVIAKTEPFAGLITQEDYDAAKAKALGL